MFMGRFQELRRKMGGMQSQQLKDAVCRELPDGSGIQVILGRELPVDEQALAADLEMLVERELGVRMKFQVHTPHNDPRPQEPVADLSTKGVPFLSGTLLPFHEDMIQSEEEKGKGRLKGLWREK